MSEQAQGVLDRYRSLDMFQGYRIDSFDDIGMDGETPLHIAAYSGDVEAVRVMLLFVQSVDKPGGIGNTPLHYAVMGGHANVVDLLLAHGADLFKKNDYDDVPLGSLGRNKDEVIASVRLHRSIDGL